MASSRDHVRTYILHPTPASKAPNVEIDLGGCKLWRADLYVRLVLDDTKRGSRLLLLLLMKLEIQITRPRTYTEHTETASAFEYGGRPGHRRPRRRARHRSPATGSSDGGRTSRKGAPALLQPAVLAALAVGRARTARRHVARDPFFSGRFLDVHRGPGASTQLAGVRGGESATAASVRLFPQARSSTPHLLTGEDGPKSQSDEFANVQYKNAWRSWPWWIAQVQNPEETN